MIKEEFVPTSPLERLEFTKMIFTNEPIVQSNMELYGLMRKMVKTVPKKEQEFRRHVAARSMIDGKEFVANIDKATEFYGQMKEFYDWIDKKVNEISK